MGFVKRDCLSITHLLSGRFVFTYKFLEYVNKAITLKVYQTDLWNEETIYQKQNMK